MTAVTPRDERTASEVGEAQKPGEKPAWVSYAIVAACLILYFLPFLRVLSWYADEGTLITGATRVLDGQVPYRDFFEVMGPGTFYHIAFFLKVFGSTWLATRLCLLTTVFAVTLLLFHLSRRLDARHAVLPVILSISVSYPFWTMISHHTNSALFGLLSFSIFLLWTEKRNSVLLFLAGAGAGIATLYLQPQGTLLCAAFGILVFFGTPKRRIQYLGALLGGFCVPIALVATMFWRADGLGDLVYANVLVPLTNYGDVNVVPYGQGFRDYWNMLATAFGAVSPFAVAQTISGFFSIPPLIVLGLPIILAVLAFFCGRDAFNRRRLPYWVAGSAFWFSEIHRKDWTHLVYGSPLLMILVADLWRHSAGKWSRRSLQVVAMSAVTLGALNVSVVMIPSKPQYTRRGIVYSSRLKSDPVLAFLNEHTRPGAAIFCYPYVPQYYFLTATRNPTRYSFLMYGMNTKGQFEDATQVLETNRVLYVIWDHTFVKYVHRFFPRYHIPAPNQQIMEAYLMDHYRPVSGSGDQVQILERRESATTPGVGLRTVEESQGHE